MALRPSKKRVLCGHCDELVSRSTYYQHKRLYFHVQSQKWSKERVFNSVPDDFMFEGDAPLSDGSENDTSKLPQFVQSN